MTKLTANRQRLHEPIYVLLCVIVCILQPTFCSANEPSRDLKQLAHVLNSQFEQANPLWVKYKTKNFLSARSQNEAHGTPRRASGKPAIIPKTEDLSYSSESEYARKGTKIRSWTTVTDQSLRTWYGPDFCIYNGESAIQPSGESNVFWIKRNYDNTVVQEEPAALAGQDNLRYVLSKWITNPRLLTHLTSLSSSTTGSPVVVLSWTYPVTGWTTRCWVCPDQNWQVQRQEDYDKQNRLLRRHIVTNYSLINGLNYPMKGSKAEFYPDGKAISQIDFNVERVENTMAAVPDSLFTFELPKGSQLWDEDLRVAVRDTDLTESHLAAIVNNLAPHRVSAFYFLAPSLLIGAIGLCLYFDAWSRIYQLFRKR